MFTYGYEVARGLVVECQEYRPSPTSIRELLRAVQGTALGTETHCPEQSIHICRNITDEDRFYDISSPGSLCVTVYRIDV